MKFVLCCFLFLAPVLHAANLTHYQSSPEGTSLQTFSLSKSMTQTRRTNAFDRSLKLRLGTFALAGGESVVTEERLVNGILAQIQTVEETLRRRGSSFNDLSPVKPHGAFFMVENFRVSESSRIYPELLKIFRSLSLKKWRQLEGIRITDDLKSLTTIRGGKEVSTQAFSYAFHCNRERPPGYCLFKDQGILFVD